MYVAKWLCVAEQVLLSFGIFKICGENVRISVHSPGHTRKKTEKKAFCYGDMMMQAKAASRFSDGKMRKRLLRV